MKRLVPFLIALIPSMVFAQGNDLFTGEWEPNTKNTISSIKIKLTENGTYKVRLTEYDGNVMVTSAEISNGALIADFEEETNHGKYWVDPASHKIFAAEGSGRAESYGEVTGWANGNPNYSKTNSRYNSADMEENHLCIKLVPSNGDLQLVRKLYATYCKGQTPMFYQESTWVSTDITFTKW